MSYRIGIDIGRHRIRAVAVGGRARPESMELDWNGADIGDAVSVLHERFGPGASIALAVGTEWLFMKRVLLPPVDAAQRRQILTFEPERFFPVRGDGLVVSVRTHDDLVYAAPRQRVEAWIEAAERLGTVERVEPVPAAIARACGAARTPAAAVVVMGQDGEGAGMQIVDGRVEAARRVRGTAADVLDAISDGATSPVFLLPWTEAATGAIAERFPDAPVQAMPTMSGLPGDFVGAWGAVLGLGGPEGESLAPESLRRRLARRRRGRAVMATAGLAAACAFALVSFDASRNRAAAAVDANLARLGVETADIVALQAEAARLETEMRTLDATVAGRPDALEVLLEVSGLLPGDAYLRSLGGGEAGEWELDGYARNAAALIPILESSPMFVDVRFRAGTMRLRIGNEDYESFALALRRAPAP